MTGLFIKTGPVGFIPTCCRVPKNVNFGTPMKKRSALFHLKMLPRLYYWLKPVWIGLPFINVPGVKDLLTADEHKQTYLEYFDSHKRFLTDYYQCFNRKIFDPNGNTICCITGHQLCMSDISDITRDNRFDIKDTDLQMGHNIPRQEGFITIRGCNLIPMSRRGNLIIGEKVFTENAWVDELRRICSYY